MTNENTVLVSSYLPLVSTGPEASDFEPYYSGIGTGTLLILMIVTTVILCILIKRKGAQSNTVIPVPETGWCNILIYGSTLCIDLGADHLIHGGAMVFPL